MDTQCRLIGSAVQNNSTKKIERRWEDFSRYENGALLEKGHCFCCKKVENGALFEKGHHVVPLNKGHCFLLHKKVKSGTIL